MATLVFDIETSALPLEMFDEVQQEYLFREVEKIPEEAARETRRTEVHRQFNLWPFTAQVVCIAMLNAESCRGQVLFTAEDFEEDAGDAGPVEFVSCADELELLTAFWDVARRVWDSLMDPDRKETIMLSFDRMLAEVRSGTPNRRTVDLPVTALAEMLAGAQREGRVAADLDARVLATALFNCQQGTRAYVLRTGDTETAAAVLALLEDLVSRTAPVAAAR